MSFTPLTSAAAAGAYAAITAAGKQKDIVLTSIDGGRLGVQYVIDDRIAATVMQFPKMMATRGVDYVIDFVKTGKKPSGFINTGATQITDEVWHRELLGRAAMNISAHCLRRRRTGTVYAKLLVGVAVNDPSPTFSTRRQNALFFWDESPAEALK